MFDDIALGSFLEQPARKDARHLAFAIGDENAHERPGFGRRFPRRRGFAGAQLNDDVADAARLSGLEFEIPRQSVALVEQAEHRNPLCHRRDPGKIACRGGKFFSPERFGHVGVAFAFLGKIAGAAAAEQRQRAQRCNGEPHRDHPSGDQAS